MRADLLHVVTCIANPIRWESRMRTYLEFEQHMLDSGVRLTVVECQYGDRPFEIAQRAGVNLVQVRAKTVVWNKENLLNIGISRLPPDWKYLAWIDADVIFRRDNWASECVHALQQYDVIQPWSDCYDLGPHDEHINHHKSFLRQWWHDKPVMPGYYGGDYAHPGYAWAATREAINGFGRLFEIGSMGAGDHHMALALVGQAEKSLPGTGVHPAYRKHLFQWQTLAIRTVNFNLGFQWGTIEHRFHGRKSDRRYQSRWDIVIAHEFDPDTDLLKNSFGVLELATNKPRLRHALDRYFRARNEDVNWL